MRHARYAKKAIKAVQRLRPQPHGGSHMLIIPWRVIARDGAVSQAVVGEQLAARGPEGGEVALPGLDVEEVEMRREASVGPRERGGVPGGVVADGVLEPVGGAEGLAG